MNAPDIDRDRFEMRKPCVSCDHERCASCDRHCYNAPRTETGRAKRTVSTIHNGIRPKLRARVLELCGGRCLFCAARGVPLHVGHMISVAAGLRFGLTDAEINDEENLAAMCEECNLGQGEKPVSLRLVIAILRANIAWRNKHEGSPWSFEQDIETT